MAGSRREVEDRSDSGSPAPSSQTRRSGRRARKRKVRFTFLEESFNGRLLIRLSDDSVERMNSGVEKTRKMKTRQKQTNPREKMNHLRRLMRMRTLRSGRGKKMTKWNGLLRRFACTQLLI